MTPQRPLQLGLTGGIGSGKSTVAQLLVQGGAALIDADAISRATTAPNGAAMPAIRSHFGAVFVTGDGAMDRQRMRAHVFDNPSAKKELEAIIHPLVAQAIAAQAEQHCRDGKACMVFDIPLLVESGHWRAKLDRVVVVDCSTETQVQRVSARNSMAAPEVHKIIASQASRAQRLRTADWVLYNDGISLQALARHVSAMGMRFGL